MISSEWPLKKEPWFPLQNLRWIQSGNDFFDELEQLIQSAKESLHMEMYIFSDDSTGKKIKRALLEAAKRNVKVYLLIDAFGSHSPNNTFWQELKTAGILVRKFGRLRIGKRFQPGRRLHQKLVVADKSHYIIGGINIGNHYSGIDQSAPWLDFAVGFTAPAIFDWSGNFQKRLKVNPRKSKNDFTKHGPIGQLVQNDWWMGQTGISQSYRKGIKNAKSSITIAASYFIPGKRVRQALELARNRGVAVKVLVSQKSDVAIAQRAANYYLRWLAKHGIEVYEWPISVLHAKFMLVDDAWCTIGSYNLNHLSDYGSLELNANILDQTFSSQFRDYLENNILPHCHHKTKNPFLNSYSLSERLLDWMAMILVRIVLKVGLSFTGHQKTT